MNLKGKSKDEEQLNRIKEHAIHETEFYHSFSPMDRFPVLDKSAIMEHYDAHKSHKGFELPIHISSTSGSTGTPFSVSQDHMKRLRTIADLKAFGDYADYPSHERMVYFRAMNEHSNRRTAETEARENIFYVDSSSLSEEALYNMLLKIDEKSPRCILAYSSTVVQLAKYASSTAKWKPNKELCSIITCGEGLENEDREIVEAAFQCMIYRRYSDMELGILGQDRGNGSAYRLNWGSFYFECLKLNSDEPTEDGEIGRIVVTDLYNYAFPLIRYDTGDLGIMVRPQDGSLPYYEEIQGRKRDFIYATDGAMLSPAKISVSMWGTRNIRQWQFVQNGEKNYLLKLNIEKQTDVTFLVNKLKTILGMDAEIEILYVDEIPVTSSGKRRAVICNYKN